MNMIQNTVLLFSFCIMALSGCFSSTKIYKKEYLKNDSTFVQRDIGAEVFIKMNDGEEYRGELLTINDSIVFLSFNEGLTEEELLNSASNIYVLQNQDIKSMWIVGEDNLLIGIAIGVGLAFIIANVAPSDDLGEGIVRGGLAFSSIVAGLLIGSSSSRYDEEVYNSKNQEDFDFIQLNLYSRYGDEKPEYLEGIK